MQANRVLSAAILALALLWPQTVLPAPGEQSSDGVWTELASGVLGTAQYTFDPPESYTAFSLNTTSLLAVLDAAPEEFSQEAQSSPESIFLPIPEGSYQEFRIEASQVLSPDMQTEYPNMRTFKIYGHDDPTAVGRLSLSGLGFHAYVSCTSGDFCVWNHQPDDDLNYVSYWMRDLLEDALDLPCVSEGTAVGASPPSTGQELRIFDAVFTISNQFVDNMTASTHEDRLIQAGELIGQVICDKVNLVYERDACIRFIITVVNFGAAEPANWSDGSDIDADMLNAHNFLLYQRASPVFWDVGHLVLWPYLGGLADVGVACTSDRGRAASSAGTNPWGRNFPIRVMHELGHQFGAEHTFNSNQGPCGGANRESGSAYEPVTGSTIMSYGNQTCDGVSLGRAAYFHAWSLSQIAAFMDDIGGDPCYDTQSLDNVPPVIDAGADFSIPRSSHFTLSASGTDVDGDTLTYTWEQLDLGSTDPATNMASGVLFESAYPQETGNTRVILTNFNLNLYETLPSVERQMTFRCTARDGKGGVASDDVVVTVEGEPVVIQLPNGGEELPCGRDIEVQWDPGTVSWSVDILLSTDLGDTYTTLVSETENDGRESVVLPCTPTTGAVLMIRDVGGRFHGRSDTTWAIRQPTTVRVPQDEFVIRVAVGGAGSGDIVEITDASIVFEESGTIEIPKGVTLRATVPDVVIENLAGGTILEFEDGAYPWTLVEGVTLQGEGSPLVVLRGSGAVKSCTIDAGTSAAICLSATESGVVEQCELLGGSIGISGQAVHGLVIRDNTVSGQSSAGISFSDASVHDNRAIVEENYVTSTCTNCTGIVFTSAGGSFGPLVKRNTVDGWGTGIDLTGGPPLLSWVGFNLVMNASGSGIACTGSANVTIGNNCAWQNSVNYGCSVSGTNIVADPLICNNREGKVEKYGLRLDSPCTSGNHLAGQIGARGAECGWGTLARATRVAGSDEVLILEDLTVPPSYSLTLDPGAILRFDENDNSQSGVDPNRNELILRNQLTATGSIEAPITIASNAVSPSGGEWYGIVLEPEATFLSLEHAHLEDAVYGIQGESVTPGTDLVLNDVTISNFQTAGLYLHPSQQTEDVDRLLEMTSCTIDMHGAPYGIYIKDAVGKYEAYDVRMEDVEITGDNTGMYGLYLDMQGYDGSPGFYGEDAEISNLTVSGLTGGTGVYIADYAPVINEVLSVSNCKWGVQLLGSGEELLGVGPTLLSQPGSPSSISGCTTGLYAASLGGSIVSLVINDCSTGLRTDGFFGFDDAEILHVSIGGGITGIRGGSGYPHRFRNGTVTGFSGFGVDLAPSSGLDLGTVADPGNNSIYSARALKYARVKPLVSGLPDAKAEMNYWGTFPPPSAMFTAQVDYDPALSVPPQGGPLSNTGDIVAVGPRVLRASPNPFHQGTKFAVNLPEGTVSTIQVFDAQGRLVREWNGVAGKTVISWDGLDDHGERVGTGVYLVRVMGEGEAGRDVSTQKIVRLQ